MKIYIPFTGDIITPGHIKILEELASGKYCQNCFITIGLLDENALKGYKKTAMSFNDRKFVLEHLFIEHWIVGTNAIDEIVRQSSLNPYDNLVKYKMTAIASGDGWEESELKAIEKWRKKFKVKFPILNIKLPGEKKGQKKYSSSKIKELCQKS